MISTIDETITVINGKGMIVPKEYPNWYGIEGIGFIWHGTQADPYIEYNGKQINSVIVEDTMWDRFLEENPDGTEDDFGAYMRANVDEVKELIDMVEV